MLVASDDCCDQYILYSDGCWLSDYDDDNWPAPPNVCHR